METRVYQSMVMKSLDGVDRRGEDIKAVDVRAAPQHRATSNDIVADCL